MKIAKFFNKHRKKIIWTAVILLIVLAGWYFLFGRKSNANSIQTGSVSKQSIKQTILATGQVISGTDLNLGFPVSGIARSVNVREGSQVKKNQILATLNQSSALADLAKAQGALVQAEANYKKVLAGATLEDVKIVQDSVVSATQDLNNAYLGAKNTLNDANLKIYNSYTLATTIQNNYFSSAYDQQQIKVADAKNDLGNRATDSNNSVNFIDANDSIDTAIGKMIINLRGTLNDLSIIRDQNDQGVYYSRVTSADKASLDSQKVSVSAALGSISTLQQNLASLKLALQKTNDQLNFKKAPPTQSDIDSANGQLISAQGQVASAQAALNNLTLRAPSAGTITQVDIKVDQHAPALTEVIVLQNVKDLHTEANVSEVNIASLTVGQPIDYTFDALGPDQHFKGNVLTINPASTVISGVVNYKVKGSLENISQVKLGMTVNMTILVNSKDNVLVVPSSAIIDENAKHYIRVIDDLKIKTFHKVEVQTGIQADGGLVEIGSGLKEGQEIVTYLKP